MDPEVTSYPKNPRYLCLALKPVHNTTNVKQFSVSLELPTTWYTMIGNSFNALRSLFSMTHQQPQFQPYVSSKKIKPICRNII